MLVTLDNDGAHAHSFGRAAPCRVGVEEELFLVDPETLGVTLSTDSVLERGEPCVLGEMCDAETAVAAFNGMRRWFPLSKDVLDEASFRAIRDGLDATYSAGGPLRHVSDHAREALDLASGYAHRLDCAEELLHVERILAEGNGAGRQRRAFAAGGMAAVLELLVAESRSADTSADAVAA